MQSATAVPFHGIYSEYLTALSRTYHTELNRVIEKTGEVWTRERGGKNLTAVVTPITIGTGSSTEEIGREISFHTDKRVVAQIFQYSRGWACSVILDRHKQLETGVSEFLTSLRKSVRRTCGVQKPYRHSLTQAYLQRLKKPTWESGQDGFG